jgi:hypothetical protein
MNTNTGGPAFPFYAGEECFGAGMTLRDYFAAKATEEDINAHREGPMQEHIVDDVNGRKFITHRSTRYTREQAKYRYANAMLKAREA